MGDDLVPPASAADPRADDGGEPDSYRRTPFVSILLYVLGLMGGMAALAFLAVWLLRR